MFTWTPFRVESIAHSEIKPGENEDIKVDCCKHNRHVNQVATSAVTKTGLSPSCAGSGYPARSLRRDQQRVTLSAAKSDTGFHMLSGGFFFFPLLFCLVISCSRWLIALIVDYI